MNIGDKILELRKSNGYSQEDIANKLNVSRQTVSKWETNQSTPDFDKIVPLCNLFGISTDEFLIGNKEDNINNNENVNNEEISDNYLYDKMNKNKRKFAVNLCISIFMYFVAVMWIIFSEGINLKEEFSVVIFLGIAGLATVLIIYTSIVHSSEKKKLKNLSEKIDKKENPTVKAINQILALVIFAIYMFVSFTTGAWYITWIIWIVYAIITDIVELLFKLEETKNE